MASALCGNADTGYLIKGPGYTVYRALDGLVWRSLLVQAST
jgi:hypothetical protein